MSALAERRAYASRVHQLVPTFREGDATSTSALQFQRALEEHGRAGRIYSQDAAFNEQMRPVAELVPSSEDWVLYHHGIGSDLSGKLLRYPCRRGVMFHNLSPERFFEGTQLFHALRSGRAQLAAMAPFVDLGLSASQFSANELREAGYRKVSVVPLAVEAERFREHLADDALLRELRGREGPVLLVVSRIQAHKRIEDAIALYAEVVQLRPEARLIIAGGYDEGSDYFRKLRTLSLRLPGARFLGRVTHAQLVACYWGASLLVSMSEHEGFGVPPVEAMCCDLPVLAYRAGALAETLGGSGVLFDRKDFPLLAELALELCDSAKLRKSVINGQRRRAAKLGPANLEKALLAALP
ncbi:MAG: glycosyltransferase [Myxococcaceae bacterium]